MSVPASTIAASTPSWSTIPRARRVRSRPCSASPTDEQTSSPRWWPRTGASSTSPARSTTSVGEQIAASELAGVNVVPRGPAMLPGGETAAASSASPTSTGSAPAGLEVQYDDVLTGGTGRADPARSPGGRSIPGASRVAQQPVPGDDIVLTTRPLDPVRGRAGPARPGGRARRQAAPPAIVMDTETGEIIAMASVRIGDEGGVEITSGNYSAVDAYEPGSVAKVITIAAALNEGTVTPESTLRRPVAQKYADDMPARLARAPRRGDERRADPRRVVEHRHDHGPETMGASGSTGSTCGRSGSASGPRSTSRASRPGILKHWQDLWGSRRTRWRTARVWRARRSSSLRRQRDRQRRHLRRAEAGEGDRRARRRGGRRCRRRHEVVVEADRRADAADDARVVCRGTASRPRCENFDVAGKTGTGLKAQADGTYFDENGNRGLLRQLRRLLPGRGPPGHVAHLGRRAAVRHSTIASAARQPRRCSASWHRRSCTS